MPIADARALLGRCRAFAKGDSRAGPLGNVTDGDILWAALLSLEDAAEFVRAACALRWQFQPRGMFNVDLHNRYGAGIVPWLATRVRKDGTLMNSPWCVVPCLLACGSHAAFDLVWSVRGVDGWRGKYDLLTEWLTQHEEIGLAGLALHGARQDEAARVRLAAQRMRGKDEAIARAARYVEPEAARRELLCDLGLGPGAPSARSILTLLDACANSVSHVRRWPSRASTSPAMACHGLRLIGARDDAGAWGVLFERVTGDPGDHYAPVQITELAIGASIPRVARVSARPLPSRLAGASSAALEQHAEGDPEVVFGPPTLERLGLGAGARPVVVTTRFAHCERSPSASPVYASLAEALVTGDPKIFRAGL
jgi:hypothetical protein